VNGEAIAALLHGGINIPQRREGPTQHRSVSGNVRVTGPFRIDAPPACGAVSATPASAVAD
jgi:hypothetical protein